MDLALIFIVVLWLIGITAWVNITLKKEKKKLQKEYDKKLNDETVKILREFFDEDGRRIEIFKEDKQ